MKPISKDSKIDFILYGSITIVVLLTPLIYYLNFQNYSISKDNSSWGTFGDYFGGILNPIIGIANIIVFVYLTKTIARLDENNTKRAIEADEKNNEKAIESQKTLFRLELKHKAYKEIVSHLGTFKDLLLISDHFQCYLEHSKFRGKLYQLIIDNEMVLPSITIKNSKDLLEFLNVFIEEFAKIKSSMDEKTKHKMHLEINSSMSLEKYDLLTRKLLITVEKELFE